MVVPIIWSAPVGTRLWGKLSAWTQYSFFFPEFAFPERAGEGEAPATWEVCAWSSEILTPAAVRPADPIRTAPVPSTARRLIPRPLTATVTPPTGLTGP